MKRMPGVEWSKVLKRVKNGLVFYGNATAVRNVPDQFGNVESIATQKIVENALILRAKSNRFARNARKRSPKRKVKHKVGRCYGRVHER